MEVNLFESVAAGTMTTQEGLNTVVKNRVEKMLERNAAHVQSTIRRLIDEGQQQQDFIAPLGVKLKEQGQTPVITFQPIEADSADGVQMTMPYGQFHLHDNAIGQLAARMNIPTRYLRDLAGSQDAWKRNLAANILNEHSNYTERNRVLIRAVGLEVRGVLSDSYRRLNSVELMTAFMGEAQMQGAVVSDAYMNATKVFAETILPFPIEIPTEKNGVVLMYAGARFSTSDYGNGSVDMRAFLLNGACLNGMVRESVMKQIHLGARLPENLALSQQTYELDTKTTVSAIRDLTNGLFSKDNLMQKAKEIQGAAAMEVDITSELRKLTKTGLLQKTEGEEVEKILMRNDPNDGVSGGSTLWKLTQGITAHARDLSPERSRELHEISGILMERVKLD